MITAFSDFVFKKWYWFISAMDSKGDVTFMNYGFSRNKEKIKLQDADEINRYSIQLYDFLANRIDLKDKTLLEVGSGRGGGLSYINRYLSPRSTIGIDLCERAVRFCNDHYKQDNIHFQVGNAMNLEFDKATFDVVLNLESSHLYPKMGKFISEVRRVLKDDGTFLYTDFRESSEIEALTKLFKKEGFDIIENHNINDEVVEALQLSTSERLALIKKVMPRIFWGSSKKFAATEGSTTYHKFESGKLEYVLFVMKKGISN
ncbi:MAG: class I SAM-dependent methyltransferase [Cyclobacteriaceae bacterium]|nr:class I SAM-dependent methyltransferase [Cyclobacteriaceae bacterium]